MLDHPTYKITCMLDHAAMVTVSMERYGVFDCKPLAFLWAKFPDFYNADNTIMFDDLRCAASAGADAGWVLVQVLVPQALASALVLGGWCCGCVTTGGATPLVLHMHMQLPSVVHVCFMCCPTPCSLEVDFLGWDPSSCTLPCFMYFCGPSYTSPSALCVGMPPVLTQTQLCDEPSERPQDPAVQANAP